MHPVGVNPWTWSVASSRPIEFCVWALVQDGLHVHPFHAHANGNEQLRLAGMDAAGWAHWFETVVNREVEPMEGLRIGNDHPPQLFYQTDPPTIEEQVEMKQALRASTPPALWSGSAQVGELLDEMWDDYSSRPVLRRNRLPHAPRDREEPGTVEQSHELYGLLRVVGSGLPSLHCFPVAYPALVVREVAPMALVLTSPKQWTWERYRDALLGGVARLASKPKPDTAETAS